MATNLPKSASPSEPRDWNAIIAEANRLRELLNEKPASLRLGVRAKNPGSILNAYREGDLNFAEAVEHLTCAEPRRDEREEALLDGAINIIAFLKSCVLSGEDLGPNYEEQVDKFLEKLRASRASAALPQPELCPSCGSYAQCVYPIINGFGCGHSWHDRKPVDAVPQPSASSEGESNG